jgi:hypothetical protein
MALAIGLPSTIAAAATIETVPANFTLTSATCPFLPPDTTLTGIGTGTSITNVKTDRNGVTTVTNTTTSHGTATDQVGNVYQFQYSNHFQLTNTLAHPDVFSGSMSDAFTVGGSGPAKLRNGFAADVTTDLAFTNTVWRVHSSHGDPISFASGPVNSHCDPL